MNINNLNDKIYEVIDYSANVLYIAPPWIEYQPAYTFYTPTMRAAFNPKSGLIYVNETYIDTYLDDENRFDLWLDFSHETRHAWQYYVGMPDADKYITRSNANLADYNSQKLEVDAWAWASLVVQHKFNVRPLLSTLFGGDIDKLVIKQERKILETWSF